MALAADTMTFAQHLVLWLHVALAIFTVGPVTLAISSSPRYIRQRNTSVLRYLRRITLIFLIGSIGVLVAGFVLAQMLKVESKPWLIVSATLFLVTIVLLVLIVRDQRRAIKVIDETAAREAAAQAVTPAAVDQPGQPDGDGTDAQAAETPPAGAAHNLATVERGRIAMLGGVVSLIYLVILVLMVWNG